MGFPHPADDQNAWMHSKRARREAKSATRTANLGKPGDAKPRVVYQLTTAGLPNKR